MDKVVTKHIEQVQHPNLARTTVKPSDPAQAGLWSFSGGREAFDDLFFSEAGFDDLQAMLRNMRSSLPITEATLRAIGVKKPGHRYMA